MQNEPPKFTKLTEETPQLLNFNLNQKRDKNRPTIYQLAATLNIIVTFIILFQFQSYMRGGGYPHQHQLRHQALYGLNSERLYSNFFNRSTETSPPDETPELEEKLSDDQPASPSENPLPNSAESHFRLTDLFAYSHPRNTRFQRTASIAPDI